MQRYLVFTFYVGRALGGMNDFLDSFDSVDEALDNLLKEKDRYFQIVDVETMEVVREGLTVYKNLTPECFSADDFLSEDEESDL